MAKTRYLPNGSERPKTKPAIVRCVHCDFNLRPWQADEIKTTGETLYRHRDRMLCDRLAEQNRFHDKLIGELNETLDT